MINKEYMILIIEKTGNHLIADTAIKTTAEKIVTILNRVKQERMGKIISKIASNITKNLSITSVSVTRFGKVGIACNSKKQEHIILIITRTIFILFFIISPDINI